MLCIGIVRISPTAAQRTLGAKAAAARHMVRISLVA